MTATVCTPVVLYFHRMANAGGGAERVICALANTLCKCGFAVHLVSWDEKEACTFYPLNDNVIWHRLGFRSGIADKLRRTKALAQLITKYDIRVLVGFVMSGDKSVYAAVKFSRTRLVVAERNAPSIYRLRYSRFQCWLSFMLLHLADRITIQFPEFSEEYPVGLQKRIVVIPNPVPSASFHACPNVPDQNGRFILLTVSRLDRLQKRLDCLIRAFAQVAPNQPAWDLQIIGDGPEEHTLREQVLGLGLAKRVHFQCSTPDIFTSYRQAHLFVIPSLWEGFPNSLAEALSHGLPAVGFQGAAGVANLIQNGRSGWLAKGLDDDIALADALGAAMADSEERARRGSIAAKSVAEYVSEDPFERWADLLNSLTTEKVI
jgi:glycosyltransferase involved in cell wall biosynthesis